MSASLKKSGFVQRAMVRMRVTGKEVTREIAVIPVETYMIEHVQYKYTCESCQVYGIDSPVKAVPKSKRAIL